MPLPVELVKNLPNTIKAAAISEPGWKKELTIATTSAANLLTRLGLSEHIEDIDIQPDFSCLATDSYINKIEYGKINDPLLQQILPLNIENHSLTQQAGLRDPVGDINAQTAQGLLHKYHGRALLISTGACAIHCRYCFRRHYPYPQSSYSSKALTDVVNYLKQHTEIDEIILSGGDPLILDNEKLHGLITKLETIDQLKTLRIHSRLPVVLPSRIDPGLLQLLQRSRFQVVMVIHANHANELAQTEANMLQRLHEAGIVLLNQSVLLKGINDSAETLINLSKRLFECKTLPYYLHLLDPVKGAMHFSVSKEAAMEIKNAMEKRLPGYLTPRLVQEIEGKQAKTAIFRI